jgi:hypothetical protein
MKMQKNILFRLLFIAAVLFCLGLEVHSDYNTLVCNVELSSGMNCEDNNLSSDVDAFDDDHINQVHELNLVAEPVFWIPTPKYIFLLPEFSYSGWQPPKYS